jgi:hypothetical protein
VTLPPPDLVVCAHCASWFAGGSLDDVFIHASSACRREAAAAHREETDPPDGISSV